jgi:hypothetical protein
MARQFDGSADYLFTSTIPDASPPTTFGAWARLDNTTGVQTVMVLGSGSANNHFERLQTSGTALRIRSSAGSTGTNTTSSGTVSASTWHHCTAVITSTSSRTVYLDGANAVTATATRAPTLTLMGLAASVRSSSPIQHLDGRVSHGFFYDAALTADEVAALALGASPLLVRRGNLQGFWPVWGIDSPETDYTGTTAMTVGGSPTTALGPPVSQYYGAAASLPIPVENIVSAPYSVAASGAWQPGGILAQPWQGGGSVAQDYQAGGVTSGSF